MNNINDFDRWLTDMQASGRFKTKLYLDGNIESQISHKIYYLKGIYYVDSQHNDGLYDCVNENGSGPLVKYRDLVKIVKHIHDPKDFANWTQSSRDPNQQVDTFNETLWYIILMVVASLFHGRVIAWILITIVYFVWKARQYN